MFLIPDLNISTFLDFYIPYFWSKFYFIFLFIFFIIYLKLTNLHNLFINYKIKIAK